MDRGHIESNEIIRKIINNNYCEKRKEKDGKGVERTEAGRSTPKKRNARAKKRARAYFDPPE